MIADTFVFIPPWFWMLTTFLFGITIGSFLNVVIWRLPRGEALALPPSHCPNCQARLTAIDLVPLFSFLALGRRCRRCKQPISWRYFCVELLTGALFVALYLRFPQDAPDCVALLLFTAVLIPIYFIDLATFEIQNSLNLSAFAIAIGRDVWGITHHEAGHELLWGWLPRSILGAVVGVLIFGMVRVLGWIWKRVEAMGLGDVLLARAMGAMLISVVPAGWNPLGLFPIWVLFACFSGVIVGPALIWFRRREERKQTASVAPAGSARSGSDEEEAFEDDTSTLGEQLLAIGWCLWLGDAIETARDVIRSWRGLPPEHPIAPEAETFVPAPTAIPFGPFLVIGFLATIFCGEALTAWYLAYALPKLPPNAS